MEWFSFFVRHSFKGPTFVQRYEWDKKTVCELLRASEAIVIGDKLNQQRQGHGTRLSYLVGGWTNPLWKICSSKFAHFPQSSGWKFQTYLSCHHPVTYEPSRNKTPLRTCPANTSSFWSPRQKPLTLAASRKPRWFLLVLCTVRLYPKRQASMWLKVTPRSPITELSSLQNILPWKLTNVPWKSMVGSDVFPTEMTSLFRGYSFVSQGCMFLVLPTPRWWTPTPPGPMFTHQSK